MRTPRRTTASGAETPSPPPVRGRRAHAGPPAYEGPEQPPDGPPDDPSTAATRAQHWHIRPRTVRAKIICLLMVPVVSLLALWAYATVTTAQDVAGLRQLQLVDSEIREPVAVAVAALQAERAAAVRYATDPSDGRRDDLRERARDTDRAVSRLRLGDRDTVADSGGSPPGWPADLRPSSAARSS